MSRPARRVRLSKKFLAKHRVFYRASQVECSAPCFGDVRVGMRLAVLENREEFTGAPPEPIFYTGTVERIWGAKMDIVTIKYDAHPYAKSITTGIDQITKFCILLDEPQATPLTEEKHGDEAR